MEFNDRRASKKGLMDNCFNCGKQVTVGKGSRMLDTGESSPQAVCNGCYKDLSREASGK